MTAKYNTVNTSCSFKEESEAALIPYSATNHSTISYSATNHSTISYSATNHSTISYSATDQSTVSYSATKQLTKGKCVPKATDQECDSLLYFLYNMKFGNSQLYLYGLAWLAIFICAPVYVDSNFLIRRVQYRCWVPNCDSDNSTYNETFLEYTIPKNNDTEQFEECKMFALRDPQEDNATCTSAIFDKNEVSCSKWVYDKELFASTTVTDFDLTCDRSFLGPLAGSMYMLGMLLGAIIIGDFADRYGRKLGILVSVILLGGGGVLSAVSPNYIMFLIMRLFTGAGGVGLFQVTFVLAVEFIGAKWRTFCGIIIEVPFALGEAMTGVLAIFIREWRWLQVAITAPAFLLITYMWIMPESVRWLVSQGRRREAIEIIEKAAKVNGVEIPKHLLEDPNSEVPTVDGHLSVANSKAELISDDVTEAPPPKPKKTVFDLLRKPNMRMRSINMFFCWAVCTLVYYGLSSNSGNLGGNIFVNFILTMLIEIPSYIFSYLVLDRMGRKGTLSFVLLLGGTACLVSGFIPEDIGWLIVTLSLVGKFGIAAAFAIIYVYSAEIFPTEYRSVGIGACSMCARVGGLIAPFIAYTAETYKPMPLLIFGASSIISGMLIVLLPETVGSELPQTLQESEDFGKDQSIWYFSCWHKEKEPASAAVNQEGASAERSEQPEVEGTNI